MGYRLLLRDHRGLIGIAFLAMFTSSLGQSFFIGLFQAPISARLGLTAGQFGTTYALVTLIAGFAVLRLGPTIDWIPPRRFALMVLGGLLAGALLLTLSPWWGLGLLGLAPAVLGIALDLGAPFGAILGGMLAFLLAGWWLAQGVLTTLKAAR
jgi:MFS transporter, DHA1 family, purine base/nucleoside efflux pump